MEKITLEYVEKVGLLAIGEEECKRVLSLLDAEKTVYYENGEGWHITLSPDGVMRIDGIEVIPMVFGIQSKDGYIDIDATYNRPLKARVKKIVFGKETKIICYRSFEDFTELCEIEIPDTLERLVSPFENCAKLRPYALPPSLTYISGDAFGIFPDEVVLPKGVTDISGFFKESSIRKITLSPGIKRIGMRDFYKCTRLEKITFAEGLEVIADEAFSYCTALTDLVFPKSLSYIGGFAFAHCDNLTKVCVTDDTEIDANAFRDTPVQKAMQARRVDTFSPIAYEGDDTSLPHFARMKEILSGKPLSEQAMHFKLLANMTLESYSYGKEDGTSSHSGGYPLAEDTDLENLIVCDGVIVGALIMGVSVIVGKNTCIYSASEDDGAGTRERSDYRTLIFIE